MAGFDDPEVRAKALAVRRANAALDDPPTTVEEVAESIAQFRLDFIKELAALDPKKLAKRYFSFLSGAERPTKEEVALWTDFMGTILPALTTSDKSGVGEGGVGGVSIEINAPQSGEAPKAIEVKATKKG